MALGHAAISPTIEGLPASRRALALISRLNASSYKRQTGASLSDAGNSTASRSTFTVCKVRSQTCSVPTPTNVASPVTAMAAPSFKFRSFRLDVRVGCFEQDWKDRFTFHNSRGGRTCADGWVRLAARAASLAPFAADSRARLAIAVTVVDTYLHCAKALVRSKPWHPETWVDRSSLPLTVEMLSDQTGSQ